MEAGSAAESHALMPRRKDRFGFGTTIPATTARAVDLAAEIMGDPEPDNLSFLHTVLAQCSLPYREPAERDYIRENGRVSLMLQSGYLLDPVTQRPQLQGLPYGAKPRLLLIHLCTEAVRRQSPTVPVGDSMSAFMRDLGLAVSGGKNGSIGRFKEQLNRLAASRMQFIIRRDDQRATVLNPAPVISSMDLWFPADPKQRVMWQSEVTLSGEFFASLQGSALPLDPRAIRALQHSARALDVYSWLAHRLPRVRNTAGERVSWQALKSQFGPDLSDPKKFKRDFLQAMRQALSVYSRAKVDQVDGGLLLRKSDPPIARLPAKR